MRNILALLICAFVLLMTSSVIAQDENSNLVKGTLPTQKDAPLDNMSDIPDDYIMESNEFAEICRNDDEMPLYFDCRCLAVEYLDHRIDVGPDISSSTIRNRLGENCKDGTGIAGKLYEECISDFRNMPDVSDPEEYCECVGSGFARQFEALPHKLTPRRESKLIYHVRLKCSDPETYRTVYGNR